MREVFADTAYLAALLSVDDDLHELAVLRAADYQDDDGTILVTTDAVLMELLSLFSSAGETGRLAAAGLAGELLGGDAFVVVPQTRDRVRAAVELFRDRPDKEWSGVDCLSIVVMQERQIADVLTHDHHFEQAGFRILLQAWNLHRPVALETGGYFDVFVVCGFAFDTLADEATGKAVADSVIAHSSVRLSTVGRILSAGFVIRSAGRYPHCTVELDPSAPFETGQRLASVFDPPIRNPRPGRT